MLYETASCEQDLNIKLVKHLTSVEPELMNGGVAEIIPLIACTLGKYRRLELINHLFFYNI